MTTPVTDASVYSDLAGLAALKRDARAQDPSALRAVAKQFESIFAKMMLTSMRKASFGDPLLGSDQQDFYQGMFDDQLSMELTKGRGLGLADLLVQQLARAGLAPTEGTQSAGTTDGSKGMATLAPTASAKGDARMLATHAANAEAADKASSKSVAFRPGSPDEFVRELWPCAEQAGKELGIDPRHLLAQAALETGWGKYLPCDTEGKTSFNLFGVKAGGDWDGNSVAIRTLEFEGGVPVPRQARFRAYASAADSFRDYVSVLRDNPRYAAALNTGSDTKAFATALQRGGYATDPGYAQKIAAIAQNLAISVIGLKSSGAPPINPEPLF